MIMSRPLVAFAAANGAMAILLGAFAAHGAGPQVKTLLTTGAHYQMVHALLGLVCAIWPGENQLVRLAGWLAVAGGLVFSVALSAIALLSLSAMAAVAPIGGLLMIAGWLLIIVAALRSHSVKA